MRAILSLITRAACIIIMLCLVTRINDRRSTHGRGKLVQTWPPRETASSPEAQTIHRGRSSLRSTRALPVP